MARQRGRFGPDSPTEIAEESWHPPYMLKSVYDTDADNTVDKVQAVLTGTTLPALASVGDIFLNTTDDHFYIYIT